MAEEGEIESSTLNTGTLVAVKFQKNPSQTQKYLEAEPKALGVTQIMLSLFMLGTVFSTFITDYFFTADIIIPISSIACIIAGSVAIAAQNLHLPTLKACLGMQVVACVMSVLCFMKELGLIGNYPVFDTCWEEQYNVTSKSEMCTRILPQIPVQKWNPVWCFVWLVDANPVSARFYALYCCYKTAKMAIYEHILGIELLVQVTQIALSATLAAFCCKVIQCCTPRDNVPVIVMNAQ